MKNKRRRKKKKRERRIKKLSRVGSPEWAYDGCIIKLQPFIFFFFLSFFEDRQATGSFCHLAFLLSTNLFIILHNFDIRCCSSYVVDK